MYVWTTVYYGCWRCLFWCSAQSRCLAQPVEKSIETDILRNPTRLRPISIIHPWPILHRQTPS